MSSPQPPAGGPQGQPQGNQNPNNPAADSTQMISSRMDPQQQGDQQPGDNATQVVRPVTPPQQHADSTQVVPPSMQPPQPMYEQPGLSGGAGGGDATQVVPPSMQPPQPMYTQPGTQSQPGGFPAQPPHQQPGTPGGGFQQPGTPPGGGFQQPGQPFGAPAPQANPYPQPPGGYPGSPYGQGGQVGEPVDFGKRVVSWLIDGLAPGVLIAILAIIDMSAGTSPILTLLGWLGGLAFIIFNSCYKQGTTGQSIGRGVAGTKLVSADTGQVVGFGGAFLRQLAHIVDSIICGLPIGFLAPLWDEKRQTWADKIAKTIVVPADGAGQGPGGYGQPGPAQPYGQPDPQFSGGQTQVFSPLTPQQPGQPGPGQPGQPPQQLPPFGQQPGQPGQPPQPGGYPQQPPYGQQPGQPPQW